MILLQKTRVSALQLRVRVLVCLRMQNKKTMLHGFILQFRSCCRKISFHFDELKAVAVTAGPGSYTGLRVAMSTAKGLCYALNIPLITENTLRVMALASAQGPDGTAGNENILYCPMIDARRIEVFTALFDLHLEEIITSAALILEEQLFSDHLDAKRIIFSGNGSKKFRQFLSHPNAIFSESKFSAIQLAQLSHDKFMKRQFDDIAYAEPLYLKEFYTVSKKITISFNLPLPHKL